MVDLLAREKVKLLRGSVQRCRHLFYVLENFKLVALEQLAVELLVGAAAKVAYLPLVVLASEHILQLEVPVRYRPVVKQLQTIGNVADDREQLCLISDACKAPLALFLDYVEKSPIWTKLKQQIHLESILLPVLLMVDQLYNILSLNRLE